MIILYLFLLNYEFKYKKYKHYLNMSERYTVKAGRFTFDN